MIKDYNQELQALMLEVAKEGASDLHLDTARHPTIRVAGALIPLIKKPILMPEDMMEFARLLVPKELWEEFIREKDADFSYTFEDKLRFRCNAFFQKGYVGLALRVIPAAIPTLAELNLPDTITDFARKEQGFFLVVGPTGHGKSTTLASLVDVINHERGENIITIEDPIEYLFTQDKSIIAQRQVRQDTKDFKMALRAMFREDVNVAMIGEMRDWETMSAAVTAAETGHIVFSSLHTNNASQTIDRIIDSFPPGQQNQIRSQLASTLLGVFSQRLLPRVSGGRIPAYELLIATSAVRNLIREGKIYEIDLVIETGAEEGMITLNQSLSDLVHKGEITIESAMLHSLDTKSLSILLR